MKRILYTILMFIAVFSCSASDILTFVKGTNAVKTITLNDRYEFYFNNSEIIVVPDNGNEFTLSYNSFTRMEISQSLDAIENVIADDEGSVFIAFDATQSLLKINSTCAIQEVNVYNLLGMCVLHQMANQNEVVITASGLSAGIYIVSVRDESGCYSRKIAKK